MAAQDPKKGVEWMQELEGIERRIAAALNSAGQAISELSKDKPSNKQVETHATHFLKMLGEVDSLLSKNINYLTQKSTSQPHEGSIYANQKDLHMAFHRIEHVRTRLMELEHMKNEHRIRQQQQSLQRGLASAVGESMQSLQRSFSSPGQPQAAGAFGAPGVQRTMSHPEPQR